MNKTVAYCSMLVVGLFLTVVTVCKPHVLSDDSGFLRDFVNANLVLVAGVILTITLASAAQIHLALNEIESRIGRPFLHKTRAGVHGSAYWLIGLFLTSTVVALVKPYFQSSIVGQSVFNSAALFVLFWMVLIMTSLTRLIFTIKPHFDSGE